MYAKLLTRRLRGALRTSSLLALCAAAACSSAEETDADAAHGRPPSATMVADFSGGSEDEGRRSAGRYGYGDGPAIDGVYEADAFGAGGRGDSDEGPETTPPAPGGSETAAPALPAPPPKMPYRGVNLAGAEFGSALPGRDGVDYRFPTTGSVDYYLSRGMNTFRIGFKWERLQRSAYASFDEAYFKQLDGLVTYATAKGAKVILNPHNFARYYGTPVGSSQVPSAVFADLWKRFATLYAGNPAVLFNLVNEPNNMPTEQWVSAANSAIRAIRAAGAKNLIIVPGNGWSGAHSWYHTYYGTPNAKAMLSIDDSAGNVLYEVHQYLDSNSSGGSDRCISAKIGSERLAPFVRWLREHKKRGFVGEFAGGRNQLCYDAVDDMMKYMMDSADVLDGWLWWAGGPWWGDYPFTSEPKSGQDRPQMSILMKYLSSSSL
jgi:endoglucanase